MRVIPGCRRGETKLVRRCGSTDRRCATRVARTSPCANLVQALDQAQSTRGQRCARKAPTWAGCCSDRVGHVDLSDNRRLGSGQCDATVSRATERRRPRQLPGSFDSAELGPRFWAAEVTQRREHERRPRGRSAVDVLVTIRHKRCSVDGGMRAGSFRRRTGVLRGGSGPERSAWRWLGRAAHRGVARRLGAGAVGLALLTPTAPLSPTAPRLAAVAPRATRGRQGRASPYPRPRPRRRCRQA